MSKSKPLSRLAGMYERSIHAFKLVHRRHATFSEADHRWIMGWQRGYQDGMKKAKAESQ